MLKTTSSGTRTAPSKFHGTSAKPMGRDHRLSRCIGSQLLQDLQRSIKPLRIHPVFCATSSVAPPGSSPKGFGKDVAHPPPRSRLSHIPTRSSTSSSSTPKESCRMSRVPQSMYKFGSRPPPHTHIHTIQSHDHKTLPPIWGAIGSRDRDRSPSGSVGFPCQAPARCGTGRSGLHT